MLAMALSRILFYTLLLFIFCSLSSITSAHMPETSAERTHGWNGLSTETQDRLYGRVRTVQEALYIHLSGLSGIADRLDSRATTMAQQGTDSSDARPYIEEARRDLGAAHTILSVDIADFAFEEDPKEQFVDVKRSLLEAHGRIANAHQNLSEALRILKETEAENPASSSVRPLEIQ